MLATASGLSSPSVQIAAMLQKAPELRPSADDLYSDLVPQLLRRYENEEDPAIFSEDEQDVDTAAPTKLVPSSTFVSILYTYPVYVHVHIITHSICHAYTYCMHAHTV